MRQDCLYSVILGPGVRFVYCLVGQTLFSVLTEHLNRVIV